MLTTTELRVLQFLPSYLTLQQIGEHLFISQSTVKTHVLSIYRKFGVNSRADAVGRARDTGTGRVARSPTERRSRDIHRSGGRSGS